MLAQLSEIRAEILRLKEVNPRISWNVRSGRFQLCDVTYGARPQRRNPPVGPHACGRFSRHAQNPLTGGAVSMAFE